MGNRRTFIKNSLMGGLAGALPVSALSSCASGPAVDEVKEGASDAKNGKITFL